MSNILASTDNDEATGTLLRASSALPPAPSLRKLEKKESCGDLQSRLKTRKLLGVGETDDGDVHRSKLSQILGHSDQLYVRLPWAIKAYQITAAVSFASIGITAAAHPSLILPGAAAAVAGDGCSGSAETVLQLAKISACGCFTLAFVLWYAWRSQDREVTKISMAITAFYCGLQIFVSMASTGLQMEFKASLTSLILSPTTWCQKFWLSLHAAFGISSVICLRASRFEQRRHVRGQQQLQQQQQQQQQQVQQQDDQISDKKLQ